MDFPGVDVLSEPVRRYPLGSAAAHVLGYLGQISEDKLKDPGFADYSPGDVIGVSGIEGIYERYLAGTRGLVKYRVNSTGENLGLIGRQRPVAGDDVWLTLDAGTQELAEQSLKAGIEYARTIVESDSGYLKANGGAAIVLDPQTGAIEAMASYPTFDPALFTRGFSQKEFDRRFGAGHSFPLVNRAIQGQYPPGSTYKPFVAASASATRHRDDGSVLRLPAELDRAVRRERPRGDAVRVQQLDHRGPRLHEPLDGAREVLRHGLLPDGVPLLGHVLRERRRGRRTASSRTNRCSTTSGASGSAPRRGSISPTNRTGGSPTPAWKQSIHEQYPESFPEGEWFPGDFILMTIGQGDTLVTPLQLATAYRRARERRQGMRPARP